MPKVTVKDLREFLEDFGDHLPVVYVSPADQVFDLELGEYTYNGFPFVTIARGDRVDPYDGYDLTRT